MSDLIGQTIGNYRVEALIGSGGMAQVYRAVHVNLNRPAAIKVMHANLAADATFQNRFKQEAKAAAQLSHPNIIAIHDFTEQEQGGLLYLVMEYIAAGSVRTLLQQSGGATPLPLALGVDLVQQAANGLAFAHSRGMIHRDIKPDNLLLGEAGTHAGAGHAYTVKIADFGLARLVEGGVATRSGVTMGSPAYMSPEQCEGVDLDGRSDLYSLGIVLYEVTTGYLPFEIKTVSDAVYKHMSVAPLSPRTVRPDLPIALNEIILRCLAKRPGDRFATATDLSVSLQAVLDELGPSAPARAPNPVRQTVQVPSTTAAIPPPAPRVGRGSSLPRLYVLDQNGQQQNMLAISTRGVTLGRAADNVVVLADPLVSRAHLRVDWDGKQVTVTDLGAANGTYLGDLRLTPQMPQVWTGDEWLRAGPFWLYVQPSNGQAVSETRAIPAPPPVPPVTPVLAAPVIAPPEPPPAVSTPPPASPSPARDSGRIRVVVEEGQTLQITPGETAIVRVKLANFGATVDHFRVSVDGMPAAWVQGQGKEVQLNPRTDTVVTLTIVTARSPEYVAGQYPVRIYAQSRENPAEFGVVEADWTILPYTASGITIDPALATSRRQAGYTVTIHNGGNAAGRYMLAGKDDENKLDYRFTTETIDLDPGAAAPVGVSIRAPRLWVGRAQSRPFIIEAAPTVGQPPPPVRAEWVQQRILAWWMLAPFVLPIVAYAILFYLLAPTVDIHFDPSTPIAGQPVTVRWNPSHASLLSLKVDGKPVPDAQNINPNTTTGHIFPTGLGASKEVEVEVSNRFSFFRKTKKAQPITSVQPTPTPTVVPDIPVIESFDADRLQALPGEKVVLKWKVQKVDAGGLTISTVNGDTFPNLPNEGTQEVQVTADTNYVLTAMNKGGQPVMKSVKIATSPAQATANAQTAVVQSATARTDATNAAQATAAANTSSTAAAGSASAATAAANAQAGTQAAGQSTTFANQTSAVNTQGASQTSAVNTVAASQTAGVSTAVAGQSSQMQTTIAGNNATAGAQTSAAGAQTSAAGSTAAAVTQTSTNATAAASATGGAKTAVANSTSTAVANGTSTAVTNGTGTAAAKTQTAQVTKADVNVTEKEFAITQDVSTVKAGKISFSIENKGTMQHTYRIIDAANTVILNIPIDPGKTETPTIDLKAGVYKISCAVPGHEALGMSTILTVT
ncbi:MAG: protein kinase domain-containing protein [Thermomicrobiales bacterium]